MIKPLKTFLLAAALGLALPMVASGPAAACPSKNKVAKAKPKAPTCDYRSVKKSAKGKKDKNNKRRDKKG